MGTSASRMYDRYFEEASRKYRLPPNLLREVARQESAFNPEAVSPKGAIGLMQIVPRYHPEIDPRDPIASIDYAAKYLRENYDEFGSWDLALAAYNAGPANVRRFRDRPLSEWPSPGFDETKNYVPSILSRTGELQTPRSYLHEQDRLAMQEQGREELPHSRALSLIRKVRSEMGADEDRSRGFQLPEDIPGEVRNLISRFVEGTKSRFSDVVSPGAARRAIEERREPLGDPGVFRYVAPGGIGAGSAVARIGFIRKLSPFRVRGSKLSKKVAEMAKATPKPSADLTMDPRRYISLKETGSKFWTNNLGGKNPSELSRAISMVPREERLVLQRGMIESLGENIANARHITAEMQRNLLSPAGQARLRATFEGLDPIYIQHFNRLVDTGQWQNASRFVILVGGAFPLVRKYGREFFDYISEAF